MFNTSNKLLKLHLVDLWKKREHPFADKLPRYQAEAQQDEMLPTPQGPELRLCQVVDNVLVLARDIRQRFLTDPVRSPDWRRVLQEFDRVFSTPANPGDVSAAAGGGQAASGTGEAPFDWKEVFPGEPSDAQQFQNQFSGKIKAKFSFCPELTCYIVQVEETSADEDQGLPVFRLYLEASQDYNLSKTDPFLTYGAGVWLTEQKADSFLETAPQNHRGVLCAFHSPRDLVVLEDWGVVGYGFCFFFKMNL